MRICDLDLAAGELLWRLSPGVAVIQCAVGTDLRVKESTW